MSPDLMRQGIALVRAFLSDTRDMSSRLVLADWVEENGLPLDPEWGNEKVLALLRETEVALYAWSYPMWGYPYQHACVRRRSEPFGTSLGLWPSRLWRDSCESVLTT